ncbi:MAG: hypothetical protein RL070_1478 [Bacteroidota bacterium]|jgi:hypothetical protein
MNKSLNIFFTILILTCFISGCKRAEVIELPMTIIIDHQLTSLNLSSDKDLETIISPFYVNNDSILISPKFVIKRIDLKDPIVDSIAEKEGGMIAVAQSWLVGGKKNDVKYKKIKDKNIENKILSLAFTQATGKEQYVDSFLANNKIEYVFFVKDNIAYNDFKKSNFRVFNRVDSLQNFINKSLSLAQSGKKKINIFFNPRQKYIKDTVVSLIRQKETIGESKVIITPTVNKSPNDPNQMPNVSSKIVKPLVEYDPSIKYCRTIFNDDDKLLFFFTEIFRYVKGSSYNSPEYKILLKEIADVIQQTLPNNKDIKGGFKTSYLISCSHKTDFILECSLLNSSIDISKLKNIYNRLCP